MKRSNAGAQLILVFLIITASFVVSWKLIIPKYQASKQQSDQLDVDIENAKNKLDSLNTARTSLAGLGDIVNQMLVAVPSDKDSPNLITELEAIANTYSVTIPSIQISDATSSDTAVTSAPVASNNKISVSFSTYGTYENLNLFVSAIEKDVRFMNVDSISYTSSTDQDGKISDTMTLSLQLTTYKYIDTSLSGEEAN